MKLNIPYWYQHTSFTCDPACVMMALKFFRPSVKLSRELEFEIWREAYGIGIPGCMPQGLAVSVLKRGLKATLICKKSGLFECSKKLAKEKEAREVCIFTSKELYRKAKSMGMKVKLKDPEISDIKFALKNNSVPLVMVNASLVHKIDSPHWVIVTGVDKEKAWINDPLKPRGKKDLEISIKELKQMMEDLKRKSKINKRILLISK
jgi:hypothetical protein